MVQHGGQHSAGGIFLVMPREFNTGPEGAFTPLGCVLA